LFGQQLLQLGILIIKLLQSPGLGDNQASKLGLQVVDRRFRDTALARQVCCFSPGLMLAQNAEDLLLSETCSLHLSVILRARL